MLIAALLLVVLFAPVLLSSRVPAVGLIDGQLRPCPAKPNCVSSQAEDEAQRVAPLALPADVDAQGTFQRFLEVLDARSDARVVMRTAFPQQDPPASPPLPPNFAHVEFVTPYLRFRDDVELLLDRDARVVHVRSGSRVGHSDFGQNRKRVEVLREVLAGLK
ncbi:MAG: DUF1499 domain-containing protein [Planctomycetota bacterium]